MQYFKNLFVKWGKRGAISSPDALVALVVFEIIEWIHCSGMRQRRFGQ